MDPQLPPDFSEFLALLNSENVEYLVVGGYAVGHHGYPRPTGDLDLWLSVSRESADKVVAVLRRFEFPVDAATAEMLSLPNRVFRMGVPPVRIELLTGVTGLRFAECYPRRVQATWSGVQVPLIARDDLIKNKRAAGRHKDLNDVERLTEQGEAGQ
jgi:hypothetical protein